MAQACAWQKRRRNGLSSFGPPLHFAAMAVTVLNDLGAPVEVQDDNAQWLVVYSNRSAQLSGRSRAAAVKGRPYDDAPHLRTRGHAESVAGLRGAQLQRASTGRCRAARDIPRKGSEGGSCGAAPEAEGLDGTCWCTPLYGEEKPWGCRWWSRWLANVEVAVGCGAALEVYFMANLVGKGKVLSFDTAGKEHQYREQIQKKLKQFQETLTFNEAVAAGGPRRPLPRATGGLHFSVRPRSPAALL